MSDELQHGVERITEKKENANADQTNPKPKTSDTPIAVGCSKPNFTPPERHNCGKKYKRIKEEIKFWFEIVGIIAGIGVLYLLWMQYGEMVKTTQVAVGQMKAMQGQSDVMQRQLEDSEMQQRAWLQMEQFDIKLVTNPPPPFPTDPDKYWIRVTYIIKNFGLTPAIDIYGAGETIDDSTEQFFKQYGITNGLSKWSGGTRVPEPGNGGNIILPQQTITNTFVMGSWGKTNGIYLEQWISYRDIFRDADVVGEGGRYSPTNDSFTAEFLYLNQYKKKTNQTN